MSDSAPHYNFEKRSAKETRNPDDVRLNTSSEGEKLLDAYEWFRNPDVVASFVGAVSEAVNQKDQLIVTESLNILGIGSGTGIVEQASKKMLLECGYRVSLLLSDRHTHAIEIGEEAIVQVDNKALPIRDASMDLVLARSVTHYEETTQEEEEVLAEVSRILKNGGYFIDQAPILFSQLEANLLRNIHEVLPKPMNLKTEEQTESMLRKFFDVRKAETQTQKSLVTTKGSFIKRYMPEREEDELESSYHKRVNNFNLKVHEVIQIISNIDEDERPNIYLDDEEFSWTVPFMTFICRKKEENIIRC